MGILWRGEPAEPQPPENGGLPAAAPVPARQSNTTAGLPPRRELAGEVLPPPARTLEPTIHAAPAGVDPPAPAPATRAGSSPDLAGLPSIEQLIVAGVLALPQLHLDIHVYSGKPEERFVFINMSKYTEGGRLREGPLVEEITADGVVLSHQGNRFVLSRD
jgi:general secretion pathway protein B